MSLLLAHLCYPGISSLLVFVLFIALFSIAYITWSLVRYVTDEKHCQSERQDYKWCWSEILPEV